MVVLWESPSSTKLLFCVITTFCALQGVPSTITSGCASSGLSCCYNPTWWIEQQTPPSVKCTTGTLDSSITPEILLQACEDGGIGSQTICTPDCIPVFQSTVTCTYYENIGDYTGSQPCLTNTYDGVLYNVYYTNDLVGNNDEVIWEDAIITKGGDSTGVETCDGGTGSFTLTVTYSKSSSWNVGLQLGTQLTDEYGKALGGVTDTGSFAQTYTTGNSAGAKVDVPANEHGTMTAGTLVHHSIGWWDVKMGSSYLGCSEYRIDNVASDLIMPTSDPRFPTDLGVESKPCGYPLINGRLN